MFITKFNKRQFFLLSFAILTVITICGFITQGVSAANLDSSVCGKANKVLFSFNDERHTKLQIPEAYLHDPYHIYHNIKDPVEFIKLNVRKDNFLPSCNIDKEDTQGSQKIVLRPMNHTGFKEFLKNMSNMYPDFDGLENNKLKIYRNKKKEAVLGRVDFILPNDSENIFLQCKYPHSNTKDRSTCRVFSLVNKNVYAEYGIRDVELPQLIQFDLRIQELIGGFIVGGAK